jgi:nucleoid-associated protein YgaU
MSQAPLVRPDLSRRRSLRFGAAALAFAFLGPLSVHAQEQTQDVAEAARQEKARKAAQAKPANHVYTNDDLKHSHILTPEQQAQVAARKKNPAAPGTNQPAQSLDATNSSSAPAESLGDVARRFRREKAARQAEQALKIPPRSSFPMRLSQPSLAAPAPLGVPPVSVPSTSPKSSRPSVVILAPAKRDPFARPGRIPSSSPSLRIAIPALPTPAPITPVAPAVPLPAPRVALAPRNEAVTPARLPAVPKIGIAPAVSPTPAAPRPLSVPLAAKVIDSRITVTVRPGDSLWKLARQHLGKGSRWSEWLASNPSLVDPNRIQPGATLLVPQIASAPSIQSRPLQISVEKGDSLWKIAHAQLGSGTYWHCLATANPHLQDADHIYPGQTLTIPASCRLAP